MAEPRTHYDVLIIAITINNNSDVKRTAQLHCDKGVITNFDFGYGCDYFSTVCAFVVVGFNFPHRATIFRLGLRYRELER